MAGLNIKPTSKTVTALIIVAVVLFFGSVLACVAGAGKLKAVEEQRDAKAKEVKDSQQVAQKLEESRLRYIDSVAQIRTLESTVMPNAYIPTLLSQLEQLGKSINLKVLGVRPRPLAKDTGQRKITAGKEAAEGNVEKASENKADDKAKAKVVEKPYDELIIELEVEGKYKNVLEFIYRLTSFPKIIAVDAIQLSPTINEFGNVSPDLTVKITVTAFVIKDNGLNPGISSPGTPLAYSGPGLNGRQP